MEGPDGVRTGRGFADPLRGETGRGADAEAGTDGAVRAGQSTAGQKQRPHRMGTAHERTGHGGRRNSNEASNLQLDLFDIEEQEDTENIENISPVSNIDNGNKVVENPLIDISNIIGNSQNVTQSNNTSTTETEETAESPEVEAAEAAIPTAIPEETGLTDAQSQENVSATLQEGSNKSPDEPTEQDTATNMDSAETSQTDEVPETPSPDNQGLEEVVINLRPEPREERRPPQPRQNYRITDDDLGTGGAKTKYRNNIEAIRTLKSIESEDRLATPEEQEILSRYVGWGGIPQAFDKSNEDCQKEYAELKGLLTSEEYEAARGSTLNAHYTSPMVARSMYETLERMGFTKGNILEPSCGTGNFFGVLPESMGQSKLYGVELDSITGRIARQLYQKAEITIDGYERAKYPDNFFDVAIGNVPFGGYNVVDGEHRYDRENFRI